MAICRLMPGLLLIATAAVRAGLEMDMVTKDAGDASVETMKFFAQSGDAAMQQMQAQLAGMPAEQRAMVEQMMQGRMGAMMGGGAEPKPAPTAQETGVGVWQSGPCTEYAVSRGGVKIQEICAAALGDIDGAQEMMQAFTEMAAFLHKVIASMPGPMAEAMVNNPLGLMDQIQGFPLPTRDIVNGLVRAETTLDAVVERDLDAALFD